MVPGRVLAPPCWLGGGGGLLAGSAYQCPGLVIRTTATTFRGCWCSRGEARLGSGWRAGFPHASSMSALGGLNGRRGC